MLENAEVVSLEGKHAHVKMIYTEACDDCKVCDHSKPFQLIVFNDVQARVGDIVTISIDNLPKMFAMVMYISPIISMIVGYFVGKFVTQTEIIAILVSFIFLALHSTVAFAICRKNRYRAYIVKINSDNKHI